MRNIPVVLAALAFTLPTAALGESGALRQLMADAGVQALPAVAPICDIESLALESRVFFREELAPDRAARDAHGAPNVKKDTAGAAPTMKLTFIATSPASTESSIKVFRQCALDKLRAQFKFEKSALKGKALEGWSGCDRVNRTIEMKDGRVLSGEMCNIQFTLLGEILEQTAVIDSVAFDASGEKAKITVTVEVESQSLVGRFASGGEPGQRSSILDGRDVAAIR